MACKPNMRRCPSKPSRKPRSLGMEVAAAIGVPFMTAWAALMRAAQLQPGETLLRFGAGGAVGKRWRGLRPGRGFACWEQISTGSAPARVFQQDAAESHCAVGWPENLSGRADRPAHAADAGGVRFQIARGNVGRTGKLTADADGSEASFDTLDTMLLEAAPYSPESASPGPRLRFSTAREFSRSCIRRPRSGRTCRI